MKLKEEGNSSFVSTEANAGRPVDHFGSFVTAFPLRFKGFRPEAVG